MNAEVTDSPLRELQVVEVRMLNDLLSFFMEHQIRYFALAGTMLGAVRHKGFIPWDDDIDIGVPRSDYDRLIGLARESKTIANMPVRFYPFSHDCNNYPMKLIDESIVITKTAGQSVEQTNAWITLFPLDGMPSNKILRMIHGRVLLYRRFAYVMARYKKIVNANRTSYSIAKRTLVKLVGELKLNRLFDEKKTFENMDKSLKAYPYESSEYVLTLMGGYKLKEMFPKSVFGEGAVYDFEGLKMIGPQGYDTYLSQLYGDYMTPPPEDSPLRNSHGVIQIEKRIKQ